MRPAVVRATPCTLDNGDHGTGGWEKFRPLVSQYPAVDIRCCASLTYFDRAVERHLITCRIPIATRTGERIGDAVKVMNLGSIPRKSGPQGFRRPVSYLPTPLTVLCTAAAAAAPAAAESRNYVESYPRISVNLSRQGTQELSVRCKQTLPTFSEKDMQRSCERSVYVLSHDTNHVRV